MELRQENAADAAVPLLAQRLVLVLEPHMHALAEQMLADGRPYLLGDAPCLADCALYNPVWFIKERLGGGKPVAPLDRLPLITAWSERMKAVGSGKPSAWPMIWAFPSLS